MEPAIQGLDDLLPRLQAAYMAGACFSGGGLQPFAIHPPFLLRLASKFKQKAWHTSPRSDADLKKNVEVHTKIISLIYARCDAYYGVSRGLNDRTTESQNTPLATATALARSVPVSVAGAALLSAGPSDSGAVKYPNAVNVVLDESPVGSPLTVPIA